MLISAPTERTTTRVYLRDAPPPRRLADADPRTECAQREREEEEGERGGRREEERKRKGEKGERREPSHLNHTGASRCSAVVRTTSRRCEPYVRAPQRALLSAWRSNN